MNDKEMWREVPGSNGRYEVSDMGRVRSWARGGDVPKLLRPFPRQGYPVVGICRVRGQLRCELVHRLVLEAFCGPCPEGHEGAHLNGDRGDARLVNLRWVTQLENFTHKWAHGTMHSKLTLESVAEIRRLAAEGMAWRELAERFGTSERSIRRVVTGDAWGWDGAPHPPAPIALVRTTSKYRGVIRNTRNGRWDVQIKKHGKRMRAGQYDTEEEAARAYDEAARRIHGADGLYNFPRPGEKAARLERVTYRRRVAA